MHVARAFIDEKLGRGVIRIAPVDLQALRAGRVQRKGEFLVVLALGVVFGEPLRAVALPRADAVAHRPGRRQIAHRHPPPHRVAIRADVLLDMTERHRRGQRVHIARALAGRDSGLTVGRVVQHRVIDPTVIAAAVGITDLHPELDSVFRHDHAIGIVPHESRLGAGRAAVGETERVRLRGRGEAVGYADIAAVGGGEIRRVAVVVIDAQAILDFVGRAVRSGRNDTVPILVVFQLAVECQRIARPRARTGEPVEQPASALVRRVTLALKLVTIVYEYIVVRIRVAGIPHIRARRFGHRGHVPRIAEIVNECAVAEGKRRSPSPGLVEEQHIADAAVRRADEGRVVIRGGDAQIILHFTACGIRVAGDHGLPVLVKLGPAVEGAAVRHPRAAAFKAVDQLHRRLVRRVADPAGLTARIKINRGRRGHAVSRRIAHEGGAGFLIRREVPRVHRAVPERVVRIRVVVAAQGVEIVIRGDYVRRHGRGQHVEIGACAG